MKYEVNFAEAAQIFNAVAKVEEAAKNFKETHKAYCEKDSAFDDEFAKYNYSFFRAPESLHKMFEEKSALMDVRDKAAAAYRRAAKKAVEVLGLDEKFYDEAEIIENFKRSVHAIDAIDAFVYGISRQAVRIAGYIKY